MYNNFFGFKERPFTLVPNPAYLFLSKSHENALAHLSYALTHGDGFVEITGEVGTGKTTLCRAFLENLDENTVSAYIFNPKLDALQLIRAINDEFGIPSDADNIKDLIDTLNSFLISKNSAGKNVILLIDEAQNLTEEVLEQLRLLSNLETTRKKLIQIILVGQPELGEKLDSYELRQLSQRITLNCQLVPLNYQEVKEYIRHRIHIASRKPGVNFTPGAYRAIYRYSRGIPRLINIACDRALLIAFGLDKLKISGKIARDAIREVSSRIDPLRYQHRKGKYAIAFLAVLCLAIAGIMFFRPAPLDVHEASVLSESKKPDTTPPEPVKIKTAVSEVSPQDATPLEVLPAKEPEPDVKTVGAPSLTPQAPAVEFDGNLFNFLKEMDARSSRHTAIKITLNRWKTEPEFVTYLDDINDDRTFFRLAAKQNGLLIRRLEGDLNLVKNINLPAVLMCSLPGERSPVYLALCKITDGKIILRGGENSDTIAVEEKDLESLWSGVAYAPWKNFLSLTGTIPLDSPADTIITLKMLMKDIGFKDIEISPVYDAVTQAAIKEIQKKHGIRIDGVVGSSTKIVLYNEKKTFEIPHIAN
ncbi:MAG: AAA family ATPase [Pseudomonadota bacterium]